MTSPMDNHAGQKQPTAPLGKLPTPTANSDRRFSSSADSPPSPAVTPTDGTPLPCFQKNADSFLNGTTPGVMAFYAPEQQLAARHSHDEPDCAPDNAAVESDETVRRLVRWREESPYG